MVKTVPKSLKRKRKEEKEILKKKKKKFFFVQNFVFFWLGVRYVKF